MEVSNLRSVKKGSIDATFSLTIKTEIGIITINDCTYFVKNAQRWVSFPSRAYEKDGVKKYANYVHFPDPQAYSAFQASVLKALETFMEANQVKNFDKSTCTSENLF
jgi:hypothetical protein